MDGIGSIFANRVRATKTLVHGGPNELLGCCPTVVCALRGRELAASLVSRHVILLGIAYGGIFPNHESAESEQDGEP
jgi:hypothetical protein